MNSYARKTLLKFGFRYRDWGSCWKWFQESHKSCLTSTRQLQNVHGKLKGEILWWKTVKSIHMRDIQKAHSKWVLWKKKKTMHDSNMFCTKVSLVFSSTFCKLFEGPHISKVWNNWILLLLLLLRVFVWVILHTALIKTSN